MRVCNVCSMPGAAVWMNCRAGCCAGGRAPTASSRQHRALQLVAVPVCPHGRLGSRWRSYSPLLGCPRLGPGGGRWCTAALQVGDGTDAVSPRGTAGIRGRPSGCQQGIQGGIRLSPGWIWAEIRLCQARIWAVLGSCLLHPIPLHPHHTCELGCSTPAQAASPAPTLPTSQPQAGDFPAIYLAAAVHPASHLLPGGHRGAGRHRRAPRGPGGCSAGWATAAAAPLLGAPPSSAQHPAEQPHSTQHCSHDAQRRAQQPAHTRHVVIAHGLHVQHHQLLFLVFLDALQPGGHQPAGAQGSHSRQQEQSARGEGHLGTGMGSRSA